MNALGCDELHFLLDAEGAIIAYQEKDQSWAGALAFSSEELARSFAALSRLDAAEVAAIAIDDRANVTALIAALKRRPIRYLLLDLDYHTGKCRQVDFEGDALGAVREREFTAAHPHG
ncbi:MAG TPA: hypothetical protein VJ718_07380 [Candidatus Binataceae bacterium]|nr:hypothetical protein [Candidatus Binataceae bacterium]